MALLAACGGAAPTANVTTVADTDDANVVVPGENAQAVAAANAAEAAQHPLGLAADGLTLFGRDGSIRHAAFGEERNMVVPMVSASAGNPTGQGTNPECGAVPLETIDFEGGITLYFQHARFVGWDLNGGEPGRFATGSGIGIGSTRAQLEAVGQVTMLDSSLGDEFTTGGLSGLLDAATPAGKVTALWAGTTCIFR